MQELTSLPKITWEVKVPASLNTLESNDWLKQVTEMRGRVLYENGLRPFFQVGDNQFLDTDAFEASCYHILAKIDNHIVGCVRLLPLTESLDCVSSEAIGKEIFSSIIKRHYQDLSSLAEISRWIADPHYQTTRVGYDLMFGVWALANHLGFQMIANGGHMVKDGIKLYGVAYLSDNPGPYYSKKYNDNIYLLYFDKNKLSNKAVKAIEKMTEILNLSSILPPKGTSQNTKKAVILEYIPG